MADILVRNIDDTVKTALRRRARDHGRSLAEEVRRILADAAAAKPVQEGWGTIIARQFEGVEPGPGPDIQEIRGMRMRIPDFNE
jgi:antitoxin FitA